MDICRKYLQQLHMTDSERIAAIQQQMASQLTPGGTPKVFLSEVPTLL